MKARIIRKALRKKVDEWLTTIEDEGVREIARQTTIVTGGCIASMLLKEPVNDFDVYFRTWQATAKIAQYYLSRFNPKMKRGVGVKIYLSDAQGHELDVNKVPTGDDAATRIKIVIKSAGIASEGGAEKPYEYFEAQPEGEAGGYIGEVMGDPGEIQDTYEQTQEMAEKAEDPDKPRYRPVFMSTNAITLSHRIQLVIRFHGEPDAIHANYDYVHCTSYWKSWDDELVLRPEALEALLAKELRYVGSKYPVCSLFRLRKFIARGWSVNAGQILKAALQISALDLTDVQVLEDQLTGVDAAYFIEVLAKIREKDPEKVNSAYLVEIIDRMF